MNENAAKAESLQIRKNIQRLADKVVILTNEIRRFGPRGYRHRLKLSYAPRNGIIRHWHKMALVSLRSTRKKIYKLKGRLDELNRMVK